MATTTVGVKALADAIAQCLGDGWTVALKFGDVERLNDEWVLRGPNGERLDIEVSTRTMDKVDISGLIPNPASDNQWWVGCGCAISVSHARGPAVIAREIKRRLLPEYLSLLAVRVAKRASQAEYNERFVMAKEKLAAAFGRELREREREPQAQQFSLYEEGVGNGDIRVSVDSPYITLSVTMDFALEIAAIWRRRVAAKTASAVAVGKDEGAEFDDLEGK